MVKNMMILGALFFIWSQASMASNSELHLQLEANLLQTMLNQATSYITNEKGQIVRTLPSYQHEINISLNDLQLDAEVLDYAGSFAKFDKNGQGKVKILIENPSLRGELFFREPKFAPAADDNFTIEISAEIKNYNIALQRVWFTSSGLIELEKLSEDSCHNLITSPEAIEGQDFFLTADESREQVRQYLNGFYRDLDRKSYKGHLGNLWGRVDNFQIGWSHGQYFSDERNILKLNLKVLVDPRNGGQRLKLVSFKHNLNKPNGARIPIYMPSKNIILPPTFIRTQSQKIVNDELTDELVPRCTYINNKPTRKLISGLSKEIAKQISLQLTDANVNLIVNTANEKLKSLSIPELPSEIAIGNDDRRDLLSQVSMNGQNFYFYQDIKFDYNKDLYGIIKSFTTYRAAVGFESLEAKKESNSLNMAFHSDLVVDGTTLRYQENFFNAFPQIANDFMWAQDYSSNASIAINGKLLNKIINPIKDHLLKTKLPQGVNVYVEDNLFQVDKNGWIDITPRIELDIKGYEILRVSFNVKAKPEVVSTQDGKHWFKLKYSVPSAQQILDQIQPGKVIRVAETVTDIVLWPLYPIKEYVIKPAIKEELRSKLQTYINNILSNVKDVELTNFVKTYGIRPALLKFKKLSQDNYMELQIQVQKVYGLDKVMKEIK